MKSNLWGDLNRLMGRDKGSTQGSVGDHVVAGLRGQAIQTRTIELNFKQLLMQRERWLVGPKETEAMGGFVEVNNVTSHQARRREGNRFDLWVQGTQDPAQPSRLLGLMKEPRTV